MECGGIGRVGWGVGLGWGGVGWCRERCGEVGWGRVGKDWVGWGGWEGKVKLGGVV